MTDIVPVGGEGHGSGLVLAMAVQPVNLSCSSPHHAANSGLPGWNDGVLATVTPQLGAPTPVSDLLCAGCASTLAAPNMAAIIATINLDLTALLAATALTVPQQAAALTALKAWVLKHWGWTL
ncbi:MAG: hypothetical protein V4472_25120 [Pseudomonadota bacterium]